MSRTLRRLLLPALFITALIPRLYHVRSPFMTFADHNTANFTIFARNYLDRGFLATRLGQARDAGSVDPAHLTIFAHHPPTIALLTSFSFALFGVSECAARALPLLLSAATSPICFLVLRGALGDLAAASAALLFALSPGAVYYGQMLDHESFVVFIGLLCLLAWRRFMIDGKDRHRLLCVALVAAATLADWTGAYLAPAIAAGTWLAPDGWRSRRRVAIEAFAAAFGALALAAAHILLLKGTFADLLGSLKLRILSSPDLSFTWTDYLYRIRLNLEYALTPPIFRLSMAGGALLLMETLFARARSPRRGEEAPARRHVAGVTAPVMIFGFAHHAIFRNACHFNEHLIYYLIPPMVLLAAAAPAAAVRLLRLETVRGVTGAGSVVAGSVVVSFLALFAVRAPAQIRSYFNESSFPGWPLLGQALHATIPEDGVLLSTGDLSNPQFLAYLRRPVYNRIGLADLTGGGTSGAFLIQDLNAPFPPGMDAFLARFPAAEVLNHSLRDLTPGSRAPEVPALKPAPSEWAFTDVRFGAALRLTMSRCGPFVVRRERPGFLKEFLGIEWTPALAAGRIVHASFVWERLEGQAGALNPEYSLVLRDGDAAPRASLMWPLRSGAGDLAPVRSGETVRQEIDWFLGEWLPDGDYDARVAVLGDGLPLKIADGTGAHQADSFSLGSVELTSGRE